MKSESTDDPQCTFCAIVAGEASARVIWQNESIIAFLPDVPAVEGHVLVVPKQHIRDIWSLDKSLVSNLADATIHLADGIARAVKTRDMNIIQSNGISAGQSIFHLHVHIVPRRAGDRMPELWPVDADWSARALEQIEAQLSLAVNYSKGS